MPYAPTLWRVSTVAGIRWSAAGKPQNVFAKNLRNIKLVLCANHLKRAFSFSQIRSAAIKAWVVKGIFHRPAVSPLLIKNEILYTRYRLRDSEEQPRESLPLPLVRFFLEYQKARSEYLRSRPWKNPAKKFQPLEKQERFLTQRRSTLLETFSKKGIESSRHSNPFYDDT